MDDYIEIYPSSEVNIENGLTFEFYAYSESGEVAAMLSKTDKNPNNYTTNRFRTSFSNTMFLCCMSNINCESSWQQNTTNKKHWIIKDIQENFGSLDGGYLTMTVNIEEDTIALYWKGKYIDSTTCSHDWLIGGGLTASDIPFTIGLQLGGSEYTEYYSKMDLYACRLYNKVLTAEEIKQNCEKTISYHNLLVQESKQ